jgi:quinol monooxygenase YgiN
MARQRPPRVRAIVRTCCFTLRHTNDGLARATVPMEDTDDEVVQDAPGIVGVLEPSAPRTVIGTLAPRPAEAACSPDRSAVEVDAGRPRPSSVAGPKGTGIRTTQPGVVMGQQLEVIAHLRIRPGQLEGFKAQAAEMLRLTREKDTQTLRWDWFINEDGTDCEVHEVYTGEEGLIEHNMHVMEPRALLFKDYAFDHRMSFYGEVSPNLREIAQKYAGGASVYSFLQGLEAAPAL